MILPCANALVTVSGTLVGNGSYTRLPDAFTAINSRAKSRVHITISITGNTTEAAVVWLNQGTWTSLTTSPTGASAPA